MENKAHAKSMTVDEALETALTELTTLFTGTTISLWKDALYRTENGELLSVKSTAIKWVDLAKEGRLKIMLTHTRGLIVKTN